MIRLSSVIKAKQNEAESLSQAYQQQQIENEEKRRILADGNEKELIENTPVKTGAMFTLTREFITTSLPAVDAGLLIGKTSFMQLQVGDIVEGKVTVLQTSALCKACRRRNRDSAYL